MDRDDLVRLLDWASTIDQAYVEVRRARAEYPVLLAGFRKGVAVVHCMPNAMSVALLCGDGSVPASRTRDVLIMDDLVTFSGDHLMVCASARAALTSFVDGSDVRSLGEWQGH